MRINSFKSTGRLASLMLSALVSAGCATQSEVAELAPVTRIDLPSEQTTREVRGPQTPAVTAATTATAADVKSRLLAHHATWRGTPHVMGGMTRKGVDCSAYIWHTYRDLFNQSLPRTTWAQARLGEHVPRSKLREGDLVFFKIRPGRRHAGIYVGNGRFAHASYSKGVTISALDNVYWKRRYWQSRRLL